MAISLRETLTELEGTSRDLYNSVPLSFCWTSGKPILREGSAPFLTPQEDLHWLVILTTSIFFLWIYHLIE